MFSNANPVTFRRFNGDKGRLELEVVETQFREIADAQTVGPGSIHGTQS